MDALAIYHANCMDGLAAAYICAKALSFGNSIELLPYHYNTKPPVLVGFTDVYLLDFSFPREEMVKLLEENPRTHFTVIDHHKTAEPLSDLSRRNFTFFYAPEHSGAMLTWKFFNPRCNTNCAPLFIQYVEDRDLWKFVLPCSKALNMYIRELNPKIDQIEALVMGFEDDDTLKDFALQGVALLTKQAEYVLAATLSPSYLLLDGVNFPIPYVKLNKHSSEVLEALYQKENTPCSIGWRVWNNCEVKLEFRSHGDFDVSVLAKQLGGGGHKNAAGTVISRSRAAELFGKDLLGQSGKTTCIMLLNCVT